MKLSDLDQWQQDILNEKEKHIAIRTGRQVGKTTAIAIKAAEHAVSKPNQTVLVIASVERQAQNLFEKTMEYVHDNYKKHIKMGKDKPTKHKVTFTNRSVIHCVPTGLDGHGIRGYTVNLLIADEAAFIQEPVWAAVTPMLAVTKGQIILLSTPYGKQGFFYERFKPEYKEKWKTVHLTSMDCPRVDKEHIEEQRKSMSKIEFAQEYLGEFVDDLKQLFPDSLINQCMTLNVERPNNHPAFLGVDVARFGGDENTFITVTLEKDRVYMRDMIVSSNESTVKPVMKIIELEQKWKYKKIYVDDGGIGGAVVDMLKETPLKRKVIGINNAQRPLDHNSNRKKMIMKEYLYRNLLTLMEQGKIKLLKSPELFQSLKSIQVEEDVISKKTKIYGTQKGKYTHIAEGLVRAAYCYKDKNLNVYIF